MNKVVLTIVILSAYVSHNYSILVTGDPAAPANTTYSFNVGFTVFDARSENSFARWWTATSDASIATAPDTTKQFGLAFINQVESYVPQGTIIQAQPMANSEQASIYQLNNANTLVDVASAPNPIWGNAFSLFDVTFQHPVFTMQNALNMLYRVQDIKRFTGTSSEPNITQLLACDLGAGAEIKALKAYGENNYIAYTTSSGNFGTAPSKVALILKILKPLASDGKTAQECLQNIVETIIDTTTPALKGGTATPNLTSFGPNVGVNMLFGAPYVFLAATPNASGVAHAIAQIKVITTTQTINNQQITTATMSLAPLIPDSVSVTSINTPITSNNSNPITITHATDLKTSTRLNYLIVARTDNNVQQEIYALPVASRGSNIGSIADFTSVQTVYNPNTHIFADRGFNKVISDPSQIDINGTYQNQLIVGNGLQCILGSGNIIKRLYTAGDSVYITIANAYSNNTQPGTFKSTAIFASEGHILGWSTWKRVLGSDTQMDYSYVSDSRITGLYVNNEQAPNTASIYQTTFTSTSNLSPLLQESAEGGIQGVFDFNATTPGFDPNGFSMMITTGFKKVALGQTGYADLSDCQLKIKEMSNSDVIVYQGDQLNDHTSIIAAEIVNDTANASSWILIGGANGVSVLTDDTTGVTWSNPLENISTITPNKSWAKIGNFSFVKKIVYSLENNIAYAYILTPSALYKFALDNNIAKTSNLKNITPTTVLSSQELGTDVALLDVIVDSGYIVLGTTNGLYNINGSIQKITIPGSLPAISKIVVISPADTPEKTFKTLSNLYVLSNSFGVQQARMNRLAIINGAITPFDDCIIADPKNPTMGKKGPLISFDNYISNFFFDGNWLLAGSFFIGRNQPEGTVTGPFVQQVRAAVGMSSSQQIMPLNTTYAPLYFIQNGVNILPMITESTSGALIAAGDFTAHVNA